MSVPHPRRRARFTPIAALAGIVLALPIASAHATAPSDGGARDGRAMLPYVQGNRAVMPASLVAALAALHARVPSYSRQTGLACSACHYQFPQLTPFGRLFKLNGYTLTGLTPIRGAGDSTQAKTLSLSPIPPLAAMVVTSLTRTSAAVPETQNNTAAFPQQMSLFLAGALTPKIGAFAQVTYAGADGSIGIDNVDLRFATHATLGDKDQIFGLTVNNNPTVQDVWNTQSAWGYPFIGSESAPSPAAATIVDGAFAQQTVGLGAYTMLDGALYAEATVYRSSPQGQSQPLGADASDVIDGVAPYWRAALQHQFGATYAMLGTYGLSARLFPTGVTGPTNSFADVGADAQIEQPAGTGTLIGRATYIHESQTLAGSLAAAPPTAENAKNTLSAVRVNVSWVPSVRWSLTGGWFGTSGTSDAVLYAAGATTGSANGSPRSSGAIAEATVSPWQNTRLGLQYVAYSRFNGGSGNYDGSGRSAGDNNTVYAYLWVAF